MNTKENQRILKTNKAMDVNEINKNGQLIVEKTNLKSSTHAFAKVWLMKCTKCGHEYGANGCDAHIRRCPNCDRGRAGETFG